MGFLFLSLVGVVISFCGMTGLTFLAGYSSVLVQMESSAITYLKSMAWDVILIV
jgi:hypothetical protein